MINKKRIEDLRKEIEELEYVLDMKKKSDINKGMISSAEQIELRHKLLIKETKLSSIILSNNNCLEDFSEKVKKKLTEWACEGRFKLPLNYGSVIERIKNEMKLEEAKE